MKTMDKDKIAKFFGPKPVIPAVHIPEAEERIRTGLEYFCGEGYKWYPAYDKVVAWATGNKGKGLLLMGNCGVGKTLMAERILRPLLNYFWKSDFQAAPESEKPRYWLSRFKAWNMDEAFESQDSLIIDDIGTEDIKNNYGEKIDYFGRVLDKAEQTGRLVICTTNLDSETLFGRYDRRTIDRLLALVTIVEIGGKDDKGQRNR